MIYTLYTQNVRLGLYENKLVLDLIKKDKK